MAGTRLYVGNLAYATNDDGLRAHFEAAGEVKSAEVVMDRMSGRSKGFGFVEMSAEDGAQNAMNTLNGSTLDGRPIKIDFAKPKEDRPPRSGGGFGGGGDRGGYGGGGGDRGGYGGGGGRGGRGGRDRDRGGRGGDRDFDRGGRGGGSRDDDY
jgi:RNA recognition motif-containing protein